MRGIKIAAGTACGLTVLLLVLAFSLRNPEMALYEKTVEMLESQEGLSIDRSIEEHFPQLIAIRSNIKKMADLKQMILRKTQSPASMLNEEEVLQLKNYRQSLEELRKKVRTELTQLIAPACAHNP